MKGWVAGGALASMLAIPAAAQKIDWNKAIAQEGKRVYVREIAAQRPAYGLEFSLREATPHYKRELTPGQLFAWHTLTTLTDVGSTHYVLDRCNGCGEGNPIMKPFVERGIHATLAVQTVYNWALWFWRYNEQQLGHTDHVKQVEEMIRSGSDAHYGATMNNLGVLEKNK